MIAEGTPILCKNCGGAVALQHDLSIVCPYCGTRDVLPGDELGRALEIKNRLAHAQGRAAQMRGVDAALASVFEDRMAFVRVAGVYFAMALLIFGTSIASLVTSILPHANVLPAGALAQAIVGQAMGPLFILGIAFSLAIALARGRAYYRKNLRPLLMARPPRHAGAAFSCRACGGNLPAARAVDVRCAYCNTTNLVPKELHGAQAAALYHEAEAMQHKLRTVSMGTMSITRVMRRTLILCGVITALVAYGAPMLVNY